MHYAAKPGYKKVSSMTVMFFANHIIWNEPDSRSGVQVIIYKRYYFHTMPGLCIQRTISELRHTQPYCI